MPDYKQRPNICFYQHVDDWDNCYHMGPVLGGPDRAVSLHALHPGIASAYIQDAVCTSRKYRNPFTV
jgi:hypothetical protein